MLRPATWPSSGRTDNASEPVRRRTLRAVARLVACAAHVLRGVVTCLVVFPLLAPAARSRRIRAWASRLLQHLGVRMEVRGTLAEGRVLLVANHVSWLDIPVLQAVDAMRFVSKAEVGRWPLVGVLVASAGTLLVERARRRDAHRMVHAMAEALGAGDRVVVFAEGTTGTGRQVLPFHANLLEAALLARAPVQPVALRFADAQASFSAAAPFVGSMTLLTSLWRVACAEALVAHVEFVAPLDAASTGDRRALARAARGAIQDLLDVAATRERAGVVGDAALDVGRSENPLHPGPRALCGAAPHPRRQRPLAARIAHQAGSSRTSALRLRR